MEIHELNTFSGTLGSSDWLATDNGTDTSKVSASQLIEQIIGEIKSPLFYGTSSTAAGTATKVVSCSDFDQLFTGAIIAVKFSNAQTSNSSIYLNVNSTGAKQVYGIARTTTSTTRLDGAWEANEVKMFVYDGTYWRILNQNIITSSELASLESSLGVSGAVGRLNGILSALDTIANEASAKEIRTYASGAVTVIKRGWCVTAYFNGAQATSTTARTTFGTLPESWRPPLIAIAQNISGGAGYACVDTTGEVQVFRPASIGVGRVDATVTYTV